jgi:hypothetical protein
MKGDQIVKKGLIMGILFITLVGCKKNDKDLIEIKHYEYDTYLKSSISNIEIDMTDKKVCFDVNITESSRTYAYHYIKLDKDLKPKEIRQFDQTKNPQTEYNLCFENIEESSSYIIAFGGSNYGFDHPAASFNVSYSVRFKTP